MERRILIVVLLTISFRAGSQDKMDFVSADSMTYRYYLKGEWDSLINLGNKLISEGMDYKYLRQRLGYAYFIKQDYTAAKAHFRKALKYDSYNAFTNEYLYYSFVNTGREEHAGISESRIDTNTRIPDVIKFRPVESIDAEFNYKVSGSTLRSGAVYYRTGIGTRLGYRLRLYQAFSEYFQDITLQSSAKFTIVQPGYYARLGWNVSGYMIMTGAYQFIHASGKGNKVYNGHLFLAGLSPDLNRFIFEANGSLFRFEGYNTIQAEIHAGYIFPGSSGFYLRGTGALINNSGTNNVVLGYEAGTKLLKKTLLDMNFITGEMDRYNDFRGMYVYNSYDPVILRSGITASHYAGKKIVLWINFSLERKRYNEDFTYRYNQFSYLGGIKWKI